MGGANLEWVECPIALLSSSALAFSISPLMGMDCARAAVNH